MTALWGLSCELLGLVQDGLTGAFKAGRLEKGMDPEAAFYAAFGRHAMERKMLLGFGLARPLLGEDRGLLAARTHVDEGRLVCEADPVALYGVSGLLEDARDAMGVTRRTLVVGTRDPVRCLNVVGMVAVMRPRRSTLKGVLHAAWCADPRGEVERLAARWPAAVAKER